MWQSQTAMYVRLELRPHTDIRRCSEARMVGLPRCQAALSRLPIQAYAVLLKLHPPKREEGSRDRARFPKRFSGHPRPLRMQIVDDEAMPASI